MSYYIKHKDEGCGIICHKLYTNSPIRSKTLDDVARDIHKKDEEERHIRANAVYDTLLSKYKGLRQIDYNVAQSMFLTDLKNTLSIAVSSNITQTSTTASKRNAAISNLLSRFETRCKEMSPAEAMYITLRQISYDEFQDITGWQHH